MFVKSVPGESLPLDTMLDAGNLARFYSKGKSFGQGDVYYTQVRYLRRVKGGKGGLVIPTREKTLIVRLERESIGILKALS
jgi:predicted ribosome quality control (RQC) complex YloA/Tae2 family protein